ncbi:UDP-N-acetylglucosamine-N-acetylmuramylpentapeptide N-acetylglucosamine transferase [Desulfocicer vacuolatum DSM 3385]|uniref:UDP-N-acetylglucosamine--N-acetylmuramyl-(pentapeptide) pyrophosphoryl-undecaprenol N-acetylglucosamine transferase n=1 Tax=Desulfocicer vacuolatum DSM 3385 TaxID=1121400 RepID=A0A1W1YIM1_9BACT|nr:undecaprenyldiphospho-muramoylpentapeptide beta-N-acetylglucosaminyltransferase [Desulfocicer vacuolatum]SMC35598.1 UDP-N-acetylglucosamine-N-acetylmuramylpentapeptide N-acetylglucosamine transferase [Desulfocicer vacuolatum DSM 3385]
MSKPIKIIIAGGKTGGHLFPGIATAQALKEQSNSVEILFVGTNTPFEKKTLLRYGFTHVAISSSGIKGKGIREKLSAMATIPFSVFQAAWIIVSFKPDLVLGVGGYSSGPVLMAARILGKRTAIQEQNAIPGITNRILSRIVHKIFISFKNTKGFPAGANIILTGNPIRRATPSPEADLSHEMPLPSFPGNGFNLLITGGSQGAASINKAVVEAMQRLSDTSSYTVIHQTGKNDQKQVVNAYKEMDINATARAFFHDMPQRQKQADLIICRAGAGTLSEITSLGKPAILVPYPHAADDHQRHNAMALVQQGAAMMILDHELNGNRLGKRIEQLRKNPEKLKRMAQQAKKIGMPHARNTVAREIIHLITKNR